MKKCILLFLFIAMIGLGGCYLSADDEAQKPTDMNLEDLPDVRAFQDAFTREFLQSAEETRDGYYPFLSGTGRYEMDFPGGGIIGERGYSREKERFESFIIGLDHDELEASIDVTYLPEQPGYEEVVLKQMSASAGSELNFEKIATEDKDVYIAEPETGEYVIYAAYIQNKSGSGGIQVFSLVNFLGADAEQELMVEDVKERIMLWMEGIRFR